MRHPNDTSSCKPLRRKWQLYAKITWMDAGWVLRTQGPNDAKSRLAARATFGQPRNPGCRLHAPWRLRVVFGSGGEAGRAASQRAPEPASELEVMAPQHLPLVMLSGMQGATGSEIAEGCGRDRVGGKGRAQG